MGKNKTAVPFNLMRQYYDIYCLLEYPQVQEFIGTEAYMAHKEERFPKQDYAIPLSENEAFLPNDQAQKAEFKKRYEATSALYYKGQPHFDKLLQRIRESLVRL
jgi:hypothetical protein